MIIYDDLGGTVSNALPITQGLAGAAAAAAPQPQPQAQAQVDLS